MQLCNPMQPVSKIVFVAKKALTAFAVGAFFIERVTGFERVLRKHAGGMFLARCVVPP